MNSRKRPHLPPIWKLLAEPDVQAAASRLGREVVVESIRLVVAKHRAQLLAHQKSTVNFSDLVREISELINLDRPALRTVINATGTLLHTGLGRAPLSCEVAEHVARVLSGYCNLELNLETGKRGKRESAAVDLLRDLTGAEDVLVVNNNAAATLITLRAIALNREVIVSRGQLIEIGGEFRLPEIFESSGALLREVGTTNKTRISDYARAIESATAAVMRVHTSNYRIVGFTQSAPITEMCTLAHAHGLPCIDDIGSGALRPELPAGIGNEPTIVQSLEAGCDLVLCSGDKLLGGPQCGIIFGRKHLIERIAAQPLMRALRVDKMALAALEAVLRQIRKSDSQLLQGTLLWELMNTTGHELRVRANQLCERVRRECGLTVSTCRSHAILGGGSCPTVKLESWSVRVAPPFPAAYDNVDSFARALRLGEPAIVSRIRHDGLWLDLRAVIPQQDALIASALACLANLP